MSWITSNWSEITGTVAAIHLLALAIVNLTPTPRDNELYGRFYKAIERIAGIITKQAKE